MQLLGQHANMGSSMEYLYLDGSFENTVLGTTSGPFISAPKDLLFHELEALLQNKFDAIALGSGPGSHTGTRAVAAAARGLAMGLKVSLKHFPSLLLSLPKAEGKIGTSLTTRRDGLHYVLLYDTHKCIVDFTGLMSQEELEIAKNSLDQFGHEFSSYHLKSFLDKTPEFSLSAPLSYLQL
jgi:tRNA A37 threonylcarbamoyladenosine modification protein TsaB